MQNAHLHVSYVLLAWLWETCFPKESVCLEIATKHMGRSTYAPSGISFPPPRSDPLWFTWSWIWSSMTYLILDLILRVLPDPKSDSLCDPADPASSPLWPTWSQVWFTINSWAHVERSNPPWRPLIILAHLLRGTILHLEMEIARPPLGSQP